MLNLIHTPVTLDCSVNGSSNCQWDSLEMLDVSFKLLKEGIVLPAVQLMSLAPSLHRWSFSSAGDKFSLFFRHLGRPFSRCPPAAQPWLNHFVNTPPSVLCRGWQSQESKSFCKWLSNKTAVNLAQIQMFRFSSEKPRLDLLTPAAIYVFGSLSGHVLSPRTLLHSRLSVSPHLSVR